MESGGEWWRVESGGEWRGGGGWRGVVGGEWWRVESGGG